MFRTIFFWLHLTAGLFVGVVVLIMSVTGVALTYEKQLIEWADRRAAAVDLPPPGTPRASLETLAARVGHAAPGAVMTTIARRADPRMPLTVATSSGLTLLVHPYTGHVLGEAPRTLRTTFRVATEWHRYLAGTGENRLTGKAVTGACNLAFLFLILSGAYLWIPRRWSWPGFTAVALPRWRHATGKARDFNWHNALGLWSAVPLAIVVASATVISYPWASDLAYRIVGEAPPPRAVPQGAARQSAPVAISEVDARWRAAEGQVADWRTITLRVPTQAAAPLVFTIDSGYGGQPQHRGTLTMAADSGQVQKFETFASQSTGRRFRSLLRFAHTGELWGLAGQTIAGLVSAAACVLVWTGFSLAWRRFSAWRGRSRNENPLRKAA